jgi:hypothetical protein
MCESRPLTTIAHTHDATISSQANRCCWCLGCRWDHDRVAVVPLTRQDFIALGFHASLIPLNDFCRGYCRQPEAQRMQEQEAARLLAACSYLDANGVRHSMRPNIELTH